MTNIEIIAINEASLIADGKMTENEELHTYAHWKQLGFSVKKGEKAVTKFPVWKRKTKKVEEAEESTDEKDSSTNDEKYSYFMKMSAFFKTSQVEPITTE